MKPYPAYKPSGVPWLGKVPAHWESKAAKFLVTCNDDVLTEDVDPATEIVYIEIADVEEGQGIKATADMLFKDAPSRARRQVKHGDIIVSTVRTYLKAIAAVENPPENLVVSTGFAVLRPHGITQGFAKYAFAESGFINTVIARSNGVSYPAINATDLVRIPIPVPPATEQQSIADYLDRETARIDTLIAEKVRLIETLREYRQATISEVVTQGLDPAAPKKPSGVPWLGDVPEHWAIKSLRRVTDGLAMNGIFKKNDEFGDGAPLVNVTDLFSDNFFVDGASLERVRCSEQELNQYQVCDGDLFLVRSSLKLEGIAMFAVARNIIEPTVFECHVVRLRPDSSLCNSRFMAFFLNSSYGRQSLISRSKSTTMTTIDQGEVLSTYIVIPPLDEQKAIAAYLDRETAQIDKWIAHVQDEIKLLQELRAATITDAVTGKIQVL